MYSRMWSRLKRLEAQPGLRPRCALRWGVLRRLPEDYVGESHVVVVEREPPCSSHSGQCEFEERPGPPPPGSDDGVPRVYLCEGDLRL
jgi:hypothetical protein